MKVPADPKGLKNTRTTEEQTLQAAGKLRGVCQAPVPEELAQRQGRVWAPGGAGGAQGP